ncbi:RAMP superfamily CRISPR-associated protein [Phormidium yuhuli AB48]|uniref:RAMP superfamily CRISPR-associated protein n=1 Tax=Phormidium yuhuli AB48 TaxID=2940671 RepID=A0ABY5ANJ4_9CYAN|nr:RAMP superfamily CRISPR-associated protein [Phormidium yuhuli]USR90511.1 RAMP superfamily CRISPR-associated protein [Phormidium yuhuli AB48]
MARQIHNRWSITGELKAQTPIHIGGIGGDADTDLALAVNGRGQYYLPGTSLAGAFRSWMTQLPNQNDASIKHIWGDHETKDYGASQIIIDDAKIHTRKPIEIREGVGIDRHSGTAAERFKYSRAILPKGVSFTLNLTFDSQTNDDPIALWQLLNALQNGDIRIGAAKTRGLGRVKLENLNIHRQDLSHAAGLFNSLLNGGTPQPWTADLQAKAAYEMPLSLDIQISWTPRDPVMVKAEADGIAVDMLPLVSQVDSGVRFVIPGSSLKGVLRSHAERIIRTVCQTPTGEEFADQIHLNLINEIFGAPSKKGRDPNQIGMGILFLDDCYGTLPISEDGWFNVERATDLHDGFKSELKTAVGMKPYQKLQPAVHVAIDRWTGGAAEGMLYSVLEPIGVEWDPIGIQVDLARLEDRFPDQVQPAVALLLLVLRDFANRKIPIGYGTNRGMGTVAVTDMTLQVQGDSDIPGLAGDLSLGPDFSQLSDDLRLELSVAWQDWIEQNQTKGAA